MTKAYQWTVLVISLTMFVNFLFTAGMGVYKTVHAFSIFWTGGPQAKPGLEIIESLDLFLVALVFLILALGFMKLFYPEFSFLKRIHLSWLVIQDFYQLKQLTWNAILLTLLITFCTQVLKSNGVLDWPMLIIPGAVFLFSLSSKMLKH
ncbi:hypothetical protein Aoki45_14880 [Algoriphagus sp. oki45]|uniref:YqhA family protein n=1 Tax=Algoriphagus sp. oki45 TaxID=3067294 RepID=UPI0027F41685|nr:hypothetical protein Aoki45_14880 [Algoriphagus sp. oki45]